MMNKFKNFNIQLNQYKWDKYAIKTLHNDPKADMKSYIARALVILKTQGSITYRWLIGIEKHPRQMYALEKLHFINVDQVDTSDGSGLITDSARCHLTKLGRAYVDYAFPEYPDRNTSQDDSMTTKPIQRHHASQMDKSFIMLSIAILVLLFQIGLMLIYPLFSHKFPPEIFILFPGIIQMVLLFMSNESPIRDIGNDDIDTLTSDEIALSSKRATGDWAQFRQHLGYNINNHIGRATKQDFIEFVENNNMNTIIGRDPFDYVSNMLNQIMF